MKRRGTLPFILVMFWTMAHAQSNQPNVVFMLADNLGYGDIGIYGAGEVRGMPTPNIDKLATEGLRKEFRPVEEYYEAEKFSSVEPAK